MKHDNKPDNKPVEFRLEQNEPNPFRKKTTIRFALPRSGRVKLLIIERDQKRVRLLYDRETESGWYRIVWDGESDDGKRVPAGSYQYRLEADGFVATRKLEIQ